MLIYTDTWVPYEYINKQDCLEHIISRTHNLKKSIRLIEKNNEHLIIRCPLSGDYLEVVGSEEELNWVDEQLTRRGWYRTN